MYIFVSFFPTALVARFVVKLLYVLTINGIMISTDVIEVSKVSKEIFISLITSVFCDKSEF